MQTIIIQGSARSNGNTSQIVSIFANALQADVLDLKKYLIHGYSYGNEHMEDDFVTVMRQVVAYDTIVFATPVYWYAMSGIMKNFIDRITDCLQVEKDLGRKLRGKQMIALSCGSDDRETEGFFVPFQLSAAYLGMTYLGNLHCWIADDKPSAVVEDKINAFIRGILQA